jgi:hypothetical protein
VDDQAADARIADDQVRATAEQEDGQRSRAGEAHQAAQLEEVVHLGEEVSWAADTHRGESSQRLVPRGLDADPALDVGAKRLGFGVRQAAWRPGGGHGRAMTMAASASCDGSASRSRATPAGRHWLARPGSCGTAGGGHGASRSGS